MQAQRLTPIARACHAPARAQRFFPFHLPHHDAAKALALYRPGSAANDAGNDGPTPIDQQLADAFNANNAVMAYVLALTNTNLPTVQPEPSWYAGFATQFSDAKTTAYEWQNGITPALISVPSNIVDYASVFSATMITINQAIGVLQSDPGNAGARAALTSSLNNLLTAVNAQCNSAQTTQGLITSFAAALTADATAMQRAIGQAEQLQGYDAAQVQQLKADMAALQDEIATWNAVVSASAIAAGVSFFLGAVLALFSFGAGLAVGIVGAAAGITLAVVATEKVKALTGQVQSDLSAMNGLNQQIGALTVLDSNLNTLITLSAAAGEQVALLLQAWQALEADISAVVTDLNQAELDVGQLAQLQADLNQANTDWQTLQGYATTMVGVQYNTATPATATLTGGSSTVAA